MKSLLCLVLTLLLTNFTLFGQRFKDLIIEMDTVGKGLTYGKSVHFKFTTINKRGKKKEVDYKKIYDRITYDVTGGDFNTTTQNFNFLIRTKDKKYSGGAVRFYSLFPEDFKFDKTFLLVMNFKGGLVLRFKGTNGISGISGSSKMNPILFRDGKNGEPGSSGTNGLNGPSILVRIKKEKDSVLNRELTFLYVTDSSMAQTYVYKCLYPDKGIEINAEGGDGGAGGDGGNGSDGKSGINSGGTSKRPGNGGDGGNAGNGGNGAMGGRITVIAHTNAADLLGYLKLLNDGGIAGRAGRGGAGGKGGSAASGQLVGTNGKNGYDGTAGYVGGNGPPYVLKVEDF